MTQDTENEYWGDDELIGEDLPGMMLLQRADLTAFYNKKGYEGTYPALLYFYDEAERLHDSIVSGLSEAQSAYRSERFIISVCTRFSGDKEAEKGFVEVTFEGSNTLSPDINEDVITLMLSGIQNWLQEAYSTHGKKASLIWESQSDTGANGIITAHIED